MRAVCMLKFCGTCKFFTDKQGRGKIGTCRQAPPTLLLAGLETITRYPEVTPDMRACGMHEKDKKIINVANAVPTIHPNMDRWCNESS